MNRNQNEGSSRANKKRVGDTLACLQIASSNEPGSLCQRFFPWRSKESRGNCKLNRALAPLATHPPLGAASHPARKILQAQPEPCALCQQAASVANNNTIIHYKLNRAQILLTTKCTFLRSAPYIASSNETSSPCQHTSWTSIAQHRVIPSSNKPRS
jgi:hypothetical protein